MKLYEFGPLVFEFVLLSCTDCMTEYDYVSMIRKNTNSAGPPVNSYFSYVLIVCTHKWCYIYFCDVVRTYPRTYVGTTSKSTNSYHYSSYSYFFWY